MSLFPKKTVGMVKNLLKKGLTENPGNNMIGLVKSRNATFFQKACLQPF
jgi:hypothetical protein